MNKVKKYKPLKRKGILFGLRKEQMARVIETDIHKRIQIEEITKGNIKKIEEIRGKSIADEVEKLIALNQIGVLITVEGEIAGHAICALPPSKEGAFLVRNSAYIHFCYVKDCWRGHNLYPLMLQELICICQKRYGITTFTIMTSCDNYSSQKGLVKVGFQFLKEYKYIEWWRFIWHKIIL